MYRIPGRRCCSGATSLIPRASCSSGRPQHQQMIDWFQGLRVRSVPVRVGGAGAEGGAAHARNVRARGDGEITPVEGFISHPWHLPASRTPQNRHQPTNDAALLIARRSMALRATVAELDSQDGMQLDSIGGDAGLAVDLVEEAHSSDADG